MKDFEEVSIKNILKPLMIELVKETVEEEGGVFVKTDETHFYFEIKKGSFLDNEEELLSLKYSIVMATGLGLKVKRV